MTHDSFERFKAKQLALGFDEVLRREWAPRWINEAYDPPFDADVYEAQSELWLTLEGQTHHFKAGDRFEVAKAVQHSERYAEQGAVFGVARKN